jgi:hypothetical protein
MSVFKQSQADTMYSTVHHYPKPTNDTFRVNPMVLSSMKHLDVDKLEEDLAKEIQKKKTFEERERVKVY